MTLVPLLIFAFIGWWLNRRMKAADDDGPVDELRFRWLRRRHGRRPRQAARASWLRRRGRHVQGRRGRGEAKESLKESNRLRPGTPSATRTSARGCRAGALLVGPPGTGKTLLAGQSPARQALILHLGVEFVEMFVGRVPPRYATSSTGEREGALHRLHLTEIDAVGKRRDRSLSTNDEREQTLNQLLTGMDGFDNHKGITSCSPATNRPGSLTRRFCARPL